MSISVSHHPSKPELQREIARPFGFTDVSSFSTSVAREDGVQVHMRATARAMGYSRCPRSTFAETEQRNRQLRGWRRDPIIQVLTNCCTYHCHPTRFDHRACRAVDSSRHRSLCRPRFQINNTKSCTHPRGPWEEGRKVYYGHRNFHLGHRRGVA